VAKILLIDIGNTSVKWALLDVNGLQAMFQQQYPQESDETFFTELWKNVDKPHKVIVSCVANETMWDVLVATIEKLWNLKANRVKAVASGYGVTNAYAKPSELGSDRWCALIGACHEANSDIVVIDCGSAITIDVANVSGEHLGGYILPGISMMKQSLGMHTAQVVVDSSTTQSDSLRPAKSTSGCVNVAVNLAAVSLIEAVIKQQQAKSARVQCLLTGGDADLIAKYLTAQYVKIPDLVIRGLAIVAESDQA
jgi:type III pantothenate kinase